jgi:hypothetical protein
MLTKKERTNEYASIIGKIFLEKIKKMLLFFWKHKIRTFFTILILVIVYSFAVPSAGWNKIEHKYSGEVIEFDTHSKFFLDVSSPVTIEAVSDNYFEIRLPDGESLVGSMTEPPFGWKSETYYYLKPTPASEGVWNLSEDGGITLQFKSDKPVQVHQFQNEDVTNAYVIYQRVVVTIIVLCILLAIWIEVINKAIKARNRRY